MITKTVNPPPESVSSLVCLHYLTDYMIVYALYAK